MPGIEQTPSFFEVGSVIADRYEVVRTLGTGGMGSVLEVVDRSLDNHTIALKLLYPHHVKDPIVFARFRNEVIVTRDLAHPNIVRLYDFGEAGKGYFYISMEYVGGGSLSQQIYKRRQQPMSFDTIVRIMYQICSGISHAHKKSIIHRDLKPDNILLTDTGDVKITDFGLARTLYIDKGFTATGQAVGTPYYMSPEQIRGERPDTRCDIYSIGIIGYELVVGHRPFLEESWFDLAKQHLNQPMPNFATKENGVPLWFQDLVHTCAEKKREDRYDSMDQVADILKSHFSDTPALTKRVPAIISIYDKKSIKRWTGRTSFRTRLNTIKHTALIGAAILSCLYLGVRIIPGIGQHLGAVVLNLEKSSGVELDGVKDFLNINYEVTPEAFLKYVQENNLYAVKTLLLSGISPDLKTESGVSPLIIGVKENNTKLVKLLLSKKASPNFSDEKLRTPLMYAISTGNLEMVNLLLEASADVSARDQEDQTALHYAARIGDTNSALALLEAGASPNDRDQRNQTPLDLVSYTKKGTFEQIFAKYISNGSSNSVSSNNYSSSTPRNSFTDMTTLSMIGDVQMVIRGMRDGTKMSGDKLLQAKIRNRGSFEALNVNITAKLPDRTAKFVGPVTLKPNETALYSLAVSLKEGYESVTISCDNCRNR